MAAKSTRGRKSSLPLVRQLLSLVSGLSSRGDTISVEGICERYGVDEELARRMIQMIIGAVMTEELSIPIDISDDENELSLAFDSDIRGKPVRLTISETTAIRYAMDRLGLESSSEVRQAIEEAFSSRDTSAPKQVRKTGSEDLSNLQIIAEALADGSQISFEYLGLLAPVGTASERRNAEPLNLRQDDDRWYVDAWDMDKQAYRSFRVDRMSNIELGTPVAKRGLPPEENNLAEDDSPTQEQLVLLFKDESYLKTFSWPGLVLRNSPIDIRGTIPYYGGLWLIRQVAACGGGVIPLDEDFRKKVAEYAQEQLAS